MESVAINSSSSVISDRRGCHAGDDVGIFQSKSHAKLVGSTPPFHWPQLFPVYCSLTAHAGEENGWLASDTLPFMTRMKQTLKQIPSRVWCSVQFLNLTSVVKKYNSVKKVIANVVEGYYYSEISVSLQYHLYKSPENKKQKGKQESLVLGLDLSLTCSVTWESHFEYVPQPGMMKNILEN